MYRVQTMNTYYFKPQQINDEPQSKKFLMIKFYYRHSENASAD